MLGGAVVNSSEGSSPVAPANRARRRANATATIDLDGVAPIQQTLAIPLVGRAKAATLFPRFGFVDPVAAQVVERLRYSGMSVVARDRRFIRGTIVRTQAFDEVARSHAQAHGRATALSLGVGLCTRATRVPSLRWVEADTPEVINARHALLPDAHATRRGVNLVS